MKIVILAWILLQSHFLIAQTKESVFYFISKDSLLGVKNSKGDIIIPAKNLMLFDVRNGEKVGDTFINLIEASDTSNDSRKSFGKIYNHKGEFLYRPYNYDNGPDGLHEGLSRFVEKGKIGFVNRDGKKVIPAQFDYISEFVLGTATFCIGCYFDTKEDSEHPPLKGGTYGIINRVGNILINKIPGGDGSQIWKTTDSLKRLFYPEQFHYTAFERTLIQKLSPYKKSIEKKYFSNWSGFEKPMTLFFDIVERPSAGFPYYIINSRELLGKKIHTGSFYGLTFYISSDGRKMFFYDWPGELVPFAKWYNDYLKD